MKRVVATGCALSLAAGTGLADATSGAQGAAHPAPGDAARGIATSTQPAASGLPDFIALVKNHAAAVVNIRVAARVAPAGAPAPPHPSPLRWLVPGLADAGRADRPQRGAGSGFIVDADGTILTNAHLVEGADEVLVRMHDRREFPAKVIGIDTETDIAVLRIDADDLPTVRIGDPGALQAGQWVAAVGSPFGLEPTVTAGIVSATSRSLSSDAQVPFIQTDVAIHPGNSGGPLFNLAGEVVGISSLAYGGAGGWQGLSFAVPIDMAMEVKAQLVATGKVTRGQLGVAIQDVDEGLARSFGLADPRGALVTAVEESSDAAGAGLRPGDIILAVNDRPVSRAAELARLVAEQEPGTEVALKVWRDGRGHATAVRVAGPDDGEPAARISAAGAAPSRLGVRVRSLSAEERESSGLHSGVVVGEAGGAAARAGIRAGDVILAINGMPVKDPEQFERLLAGDQKHVALLVQRGDSRLFVPIRLA